MTTAIKIPNDVAEHLATTAKYFDAQAQRLQELHDLWGSPPADPEWHLRIEHDEAARLIKSLARGSEFLAWLAAHGGAK